MKGFCKQLLQKVQDLIRQRQGDHIQITRVYLAEGAATSQYIFSEVTSWCNAQYGIKVRVSDSPLVKCNLVERFSS
jgi:hypothetical protein